MLVLYIVLIILSLRIIYVKRKLSVFSPVDIFYFFFITCIVITTLYHYWYPKNLKFDLYNLDTLNKNHFITNINLFLKMIFFFSIGLIIFIINSIEYQKTFKTKAGFGLKKKINIDFKKVKHLSYLLFFITIILVFLDYGFELFIRQKYIPKDNSVYKTIYTILLLLLSVVSGVLYKKNKIYSLFVIIIVVTIGLGIGSRTATIDLAFYLTTLGVLKEKSNNKKYFFIISAIFIYFFFGLNLSLRLISTKHGLIPYFYAVCDNFSVVLEYVVLNTYYTFIYGFYATCETIKLYNETNSKLMTSLSPMPGSLTNWYDYARFMRINKYAPFTAIGELSKHPVFSCIYYIFLGFYFGVCDFFIKRQLLLRKYIFPLLVLLMLCLMLMFFYEYNLRSANRYIYYSLFFMLIGSFFENRKIVFKKYEKK